MFRSAIPAVLCFLVISNALAQRPYKELEQEGQKLLTSNQLTQALAIWEQARDQARLEFGENHATYATALHNLGRVNKALDHYDAAVGYYQQALEIRGRVLGKTDPVYGASLSDLAILKSSRGYYREAEVLLIEARDVYARARGRDHPSYAIVLYNLANVYKNTGRLAQAEVLYREALGIYEKSPGKTHPDYATFLESLATLYMEMARFAEAEPLLFQARSIFEKNPGQQSAKYANSADLIGNLYVYLNSLTEAEKFYKEARDIRKKVLGVQTLAYATSLNNLGLLYLKRNQYTKAEPLLKEAVQIKLARVGKNHPDYLLSLSNLAQLYVRKKDYPQAEKLFLELVGTRRELLGDRNPNYATAISGIAVVYARQGKYDQAIKLNEEALEIIRTTFGPKHERYAAVLNDLAVSHSRLNQWREAWSRFQESIAIIQEEIIRIFPALSEYEKQKFAEAKRLFFINFEQFAVSFAQESPELRAALYNHRLLTRGMLFEASRSIRQEVSNNRDTVVANRWQAWQTKRELLAQVYRMTPEEQKQAGLDQQRLEREITQLEKELGQRLQGVITSSSAPPDWQVVQKQLKKGEAAVEVIRTYQRNANEVRPVYGVLVITPGIKSPEVVVIDTSPHSDRKLAEMYRSGVRTWRIGSSSATVAGVGRGAEADVATAPTIDLYAMLWQPIVRHLQGVHTVYFSADGVYHQINPATLFNSARQNFVMDELDVRLVTSTRYVGQPEPAIDWSSTQAALIGYPNYERALPDSQPAPFPAVEADTTMRFVANGKISELPGTRVEIEAIQKMLQTRRVKVKSFLLNDASEEQVKAIRQTGLLHIATHGFFLSDLPRANADDPFAGIERDALIRNPLLRSGILLAGAAKAMAAPTSSREDGILTAYEAANLSLERTELVVLSACETGLGVTANGEGVYGLQRAFRMAGAKAVLMSLWTVSDEATQQVMTLFYENWLAGRSSREAFRLAQLKLREKFPEPYFWGAFVFMGN